MNAGGRTVFLEDNPAWVHIDPTLEVYQVCDADQKVFESFPCNLLGVIIRRSKCDCSREWWSLLIRSSIRSSYLLSCYFLLCCTITPSFWCGPVQGHLPQFADGTVQTSTKLRRRPAKRWGNVYQRSRLQPSVRWRWLGRRLYSLAPHRRHSAKRVNCALGCDSHRRAGWVTISLINSPFVMRSPCFPFYLIEWLDIKRTLILWRVVHTMCFVHHFFRGLLHIYLFWCAPI